MIGAYTKGWQSLKTLKTDSNETEVRVSIIIAARNEEDNINTFVYALQSQSQSYPKELYEVLIINDHSNDNTVLEFNKIKSADNIRILNLPEGISGKKAAINYGIEESVGDLIVTTDADCSFGENWLASIVSLYKQTDSKMIIAPVVFNKKKSLFNSLQSLEFISLIASTAGATAIGKPIMCNGANLAFERKAFDTVNGYKGVDKNASGDDVFLMHKIKEVYGSEAICFLKADEAIVYTNAKESLKELINQRKRWASKATNYTDKSTQYVSWLVFLINFMLIISLFFVFTDFKFVLLFLGSFFLKLIIDYRLLKLSTDFFNRKGLMRLILLEEFLYSFYVCYIAFTAPFGKYKWKGRRLS